MCVCMVKYINLASLPGDMPSYIHSFIYTCNSCISVHMAVRGIDLID